MRCTVRRVLPIRMPSGGLRSVASATKMRLNMPRGLIGRSACCGSCAGCRAMPRHAGEGGSLRGRSRRSVAGDLHAVGSVGAGSARGRERVCDAATRNRSKVWQLCRSQTRTHTVAPTAMKSQSKAGRCSQLRCARPGKISLAEDSCQWPQGRALSASAKPTPQSRLWNMLSTRGGVVG